VTHQSEDVQTAITNLSDALCSWERGTGIESVLILRERYYNFRAVNGKPGIPDDITDAEIIKTITK
jgi:hypothetical protein